MHLCVYLQHTGLSRAFCRPHACPPLNCSRNADISSYRVGPTRKSQIRHHASVPSFVLMSTCVLTVLKILSIRVSKKPLTSSRLCVRAWAVCEAEAACHATSVAAPTTSLRSRDSGWVPRFCGAVVPPLECSSKTTTFPQRTVGSLRAFASLLE